MDRHSDDVSVDLIEAVRQRADVPRVRSSEVRRIIETFQAITRETVPSSA